jgi:hypothetical protein
VRTLNSGNACYHSVHNLLSSRLLSKNVNIRIYKTMNDVQSTRRHKDEDDEVGGAGGANGDNSNAYRLLVGSPEVKLSLGRPRRGRVDNIMMNLAETGCVVWTGLVGSG